MDRALGLHGRTALDGQIVAGREGDGAAGREDGDAALHDQEVVGLAGLFAGIQRDRIGADDVRIDPERARRAHTDLAGGLKAGRGTGDATDPQSADVPQPDVAAGRARFDAAELVAVEATHVGDETLGLRTDAAGGDQVGLAGAEIRSAGGDFVVIGRAVENAAGDGGDEGGAVRGGADIGEVEVARRFRHVEIAQAAPQGDNAGRRAIHVAVEFQRVGGGADAVEGDQGDRAGAHIGASAAGDRRGIDVARVGQIAAVEDRRLGREHDVSRGGDRQHLHAGFGLGQHDVAAGASPDGPGQLDLDGVRRAADGARRLQVHVAGDDLVGVRVDAVEDAALVRDEGDIATLRIGGFQVQVPGAGGDEDVLGRADRQRRAGVQADADHLRRGADSAVAAFEDGVTALDVHRIRRAAIDEAGRRLEADLLAIGGFDGAERQQLGGVDVDLGVRGHGERTGALDDHRLALLDEQLGDLVERIPGILGRLEHDDVARALRLEGAAALENESPGAGLLDREAGVLGGRVAGRDAERAGQADQHAVLEAVALEIAGGAGDDGDAGRAGGPHADRHGDVGLGHEEELFREPDHRAVDRGDAEDVRRGRAGIGGVAGDVERIADGVGGIPGHAVIAGQDALVGRRIVAEADVQGGRGRLQEVEGDFGGDARRLTGHGDADAEIDVAGDPLADEMLVDGDHTADDADEPVGRRALGRSVRGQAADIERAAIELAVLVEEDARIPIPAVLARDGAVLAGLAEHHVGRDRRRRQEEEIAALGGGEIDLLVGGECLGSGADIDQCLAAGRADIARGHDLDVDALDDRVLLVDDRAGRLLEQALSDSAQQLVLRPALDAGIDRIGRRLIDEEGGGALLPRRQRIRIRGVGGVVGARQAVEEGVKRPVLRREGRGPRAFRGGAGGVDGGRALVFGLGRLARRGHRLGEGLAGETRREGRAVDARIDLLITVAPIGLVIALDGRGLRSHLRRIVSIAQAAEAGMQGGIARLERGFRRGHLRRRLHPQGRLAQGLRGRILGEARLQGRQLIDAEEGRAVLEIGDVDIVGRGELRLVLITEAAEDRVEILVGLRLQCVGIA